MVSFEDIYYDKEPETAYRFLLPHAEAGDAKAQFYVGQLCEELFPEGPKRSVESVFVPRRAWMHRSGSWGNTCWRKQHRRTRQLIGCGSLLPRGILLLRNY